MRHWARRPLSPGTVVRSSGLGCCRGVQAAGCAHRPTVAGGGQGNCETLGLQGAHTLRGNIQRLLDSTFHACAYRINRRYQLKVFVPRFAYVAVRPPPLPAHLRKLAGTCG